MLMKYGSKALVFLLASSMMTGPALADPPPHANNKKKGDNHGYENNQSHPYKPPVNTGPPLHAGPKAPKYKALPPGRSRHYRGVHIYRPYGHVYPGYGHYSNDDDAFFWLAFTAFTVILINKLSEQQQRTHEAAIVQATRAPIGQPIVWSDGGARGQVTATREGTSTQGRYCREFQQVVTVGGKQDTAYGTACRQPDGQWEIISTSND